jgi:hypothetical protein
MAKRSKKDGAAFSGTIKMSLIPLIVALSRVLQELLDMNIEELKQAHDLMKRIEATASLLPAYRKAETIVAAIPQTEAEKRSLRGTAGLPRHDEVTFTADEIGDQIVNALERRIAMMTEELQKLGVETAPRLREV